MTRVGATLLFALVLGGCRPDVSTVPESAAPADPLAGRPVVTNPAAKPGDVTTCPYSGRKFVVEADSPRFDHEGRSYVFCSEKARDAVAADPAKYIATDPRPVAAGEARPQ